MFQIRAVQIQLELRSLPKVADSNTPLHLAPHNHDSKPLRILDLVFHESYCSVKTKTGESIGVLESRALICFSPLSKGHYPIRFEGVLLESEWQERLLTAKSGGRIEQRIVAEVDVFGPRHMSHKVAKTLGDASLFLQRPSRRILPPYENPQCLPLSYAVDSVAVNRMSYLIQDSEQNSVVLRRAADASQNRIIDFEQLFDRLRSPEYSGNIPVDPRIKTPLLQ